jgi:hypothetical protein
MIQKETPKSLGDPDDVYGLLYLISDGTTHASDFTLSFCSPFPPWTLTPMRAAIK